MKISDKWGVRLTILLVIALTLWVGYEAYRGLTDFTPHPNDLCGNHPQSMGYCTQ